MPQILEQGMAAGLRFVTMSTLLDAADAPEAITAATPEDQNLPARPTTTPPRTAGA